VTATKSPHPPPSMPRPAAPARDPRDPPIDPDAWIEEARRRARRRRMLYSACVLLAAAAGTGAYFGFGHGGGGSTEAPPAAEKQPAAANPLVRIDAGSAASPMNNGQLLIRAFDADEKERGPAGWYGLSTIGLEGRLSPVVRCPDSATWCGEVESIDWSPDGKLLALSVTSFASVNPYNGVHVVNPATGEDRQILSCDHPNCDWFDLDWSPDGSRLAFVSHGSASDSSQQGIYLINTDGTGRTALNTPAVGRDSSPSWSPNGKWIAYAGSGEKGSAIYAIAADGSQGRLLARHGSAPAWSPDGTKIAYRTRCGVKLISPSGTDLTPPSPRRCNGIGIPGFGPPVWSPDGRQMAISAREDSKPGGRTKYGTYVMNADGSDLFRVTEESLTVYTGAQPRPAWHPVP
jgi:dipeptidyl aminopeptidase/acylaminoacyl peptidase